MGKSSSIDRCNPAASREDIESLDSNTASTLHEVEAIAGAQLQNDGRIDIAIDSTSRFTTAIVSSIEKSARKDAEFVWKQSTASCASHAPPTETPRLNIVLQVVGSRGDVQPFIAIGRELRECGHRVRFATHGTFKDLVKNNELEFFDIGGDPAELMAYMVRNPGLLPSYQSLQDHHVARKRATVKDIMEQCWLSCYERSEQDSEPFVADAIIANPPSFAHVHCAQKLSIPLHIVFTMPWSPTRAFSHPLAKIRSTDLGASMSNYLSFVLVQVLIWQGLKKVINDFRTKTLGLERINSSWGPALLERLKIPTAYCWSPSLVPKPRDWQHHIEITGFCRPPPNSDYKPPHSLVEFLQGGPPPIYIGFGSIVVDNVDALTALIYEAIGILGVRAVIAQGWAAMGHNLPAEAASRIMTINDCPHDWLFQHVSCVVHHGGAGTTAAGLTAGKPTVAVPFFGDQFFWANVIQRAGAGPPALPYKEMTVERLVDSIKIALSPECHEAALMLATDLAAEAGARGVTTTFHHSLPSSDMTCSLCPSHSAVWQYRRKKRNLRLSALAATVLRKESLIELKDLERIRTAEYTMEQGPVEPFAAGVKVCTDLIYDTLVGMGKMASEIDTIATHIGTIGQKQSSIGLQYGTGVQERNSPSAPQPKVGSRFATGAARFTGAILRSPGNMSLALAQGAHNMPALWHDRTVRKQDEVTGVGSGIAVGCKELLLGTYDGVAGLFTHPFNGARDEGFLGAFKGAGKGLASAPIKMLAAMAAPVAYPLKGLDVQTTNLFSSHRRDPIAAMRWEQGEWEYYKASEAEKQAILTRWRGLY